MFLRRASVALSSSRRFFATTSSYDVTNAISEMNKEMESVFGMPPTSGLSGSINDEHTAAHEVTTESGALASAGGKRLQVEDSKFEFPDMNKKAPGLTHVGSTGEAQMVDVSPKDPTKRTAIASCKVLLGKHVYDMVSANQMAKGDVLTVAKIAGISGAKHTSNLIPLCHNIIITNVRVDLMLNPDDHSVRIEAEAASTGKTGVEMEALTAASVAGLTVYDMCKAASKDIQITDIRLERKTGGKSGDWSRRW